MGRIIRLHLRIVKPDFRLVCFGIQEQGGLRDSPLFCNRQGHHLVRHLKGLLLSCINNGLLSILLLCNLLQSFKSAETFMLQALAAAKAFLATDQSIYLPQISINRWPNSSRI